MLKSCFPLDVRYRMNFPTRSGTQNGNAHVLVFMVRLSQPRIQAWLWTCTGKEVMRLYFGNKDKKSKWKQRLVTGGMAALIGAAAFCILSASFTAKDKTGESRFWGRTAVWIQKQINRTYLPVFAFMEEETGIHKDAAEFLRDVILLQMPIYKYSEEQAQVQISIEDEDTFDMLIREEGKIGRAHV